MRRTRTALLAVFAAMVMGLSGCGLGTAGGRILSGELAGPLDGISLDGVPVGVGSKNFSENIILGKMTLSLLASAGADVTDLTNIPGSASARQAQLEGQIDLLWDYTGTAWLTYLGQTKVITDSHDMYVAVRDEDKKNGIDWLPPAPMNNTYGFAMNPKVTKRLGITKLSQIKDLPVKERTFCIESEFANRPDGLPGMLKKYGIPLEDPNGVPRENLKNYQTGAIYTATAAGRCNFGEIYTTDGRINSLHLTVLEDDKKYFPKYNVAPLVRHDVLQKYPQIADLLAPVTKKLTDEVLIRLNSKVDVEGEDPAQVAYDWLLREGFIKE